jgi:hypothetical protein
MARHGVDPRRVPQPPFPLLPSPLQHQLPPHFQHAHNLQQLRHHQLHSHPHSHLHHHHQPQRQQLQHQHQQYQPAHWVGFSTGPHSSVLPWPANAPTPHSFNTASSLAHSTDLSSAEHVQQRNHQQHSSHPPQPQQQQAHGQSMGFDVASLFSPVRFPSPALANGVS